MLKVLALPGDGENGGHAGCWSKVVMRVPILLPNDQARRRRGSPFGGAWGFTLVEVAISIAVLAITSVGGVSAFMLLNKYAASIRNDNMARSLCQERIEQALTLVFLPKTGVVPLAPASDLVNYPGGTCAILGTAGSYNTTTGAYTGSPSTPTSTETIVVATQSENATATAAAPGSANVTYTRTTTVSATALGVVQFTVTVSYVFRGVTYTDTMTTYRSPDVAS